MTKETDDHKVIWEPLKGSQQLFQTCPYREVLYQGSRGGGKTDNILMSFAGKVGMGYGPFWSGIIFRRSYKELDDIIAKSQRWFTQIFPDAHFYRGKGDYKWVFATGEILSFRVMVHKDDYWNYHGQEYPFIAWEELTTWPDISCYEAMFSCNRTSYTPDNPVITHPNPPDRLIPQVRSSTNPYGVGHSWVKEYFIDRAPNGVPFHDTKKDRTRIHIASMMFENPYLNDEYISDMKGLDDENLRLAWLYGSWDIVAGGMFSHVWNPQVHIVEDFKIPKSWIVDRSFDWGSSKPFCTLWYAQSDGTDYVDPDGNEHATNRGDVFVICEDYGWNGSPNQGLRLTNKEIARRVVAVERDNPLFKNHRVHAGPADTSIYTVENGHSIADDMKTIGIRWRRADKSSGSRVAGWQVIIQMMKNSVSKEDNGLYFFESCEHSKRLLPVTPRDDKNMDDIDTDFEDHLQDTLRYRLRKKKNKGRVRHV